MANDNTIYWHYSKLYEKQLARLEGEKFSQHNKDLILRFHDHLFTTGTKKERVAKLTWGLRAICNLLKSDLDKATKSDIERIVAAMQRNNNQSEATKSDYKRCLKHFFKWFEDEDPRLENGDENARREAQKMYKYLRKYVTTTCPMKQIDPGSIITDEDISQVLEKGCISEMERAFVKTLHETGCRIGELLGLKIKDISRKNPHWVLYVNGKTGERPRPIYTSIPYLLRWLDFHPDKNNSDAHVWVSEKNRFYGRRLHYVGACKLIKRTFLKAGFGTEDKQGKITWKKQCNPHHFRHSRATIDASKLNDSMQCQIMGWSQGSQQVKRYRHIAGKQAEQAFLEAQGLVEDKQKLATPKNKRCVCGRENEPSAKYCSTCGKPLELATALQEQEYNTLAFTLLEKIMSDPGLKEKFEEFKLAENAENARRTY